MKILDNDPDFDNNLESHMYPRRAIVISLIRRIRRARSIDELASVVECPGDDAYFVHDGVCRLYFELLEEDRVKLLGFIFTTT